MVRRGKDLVPRLSRTSTPLERYWSKVAKRGPDECWPWLAKCTAKGYGQFSVNRTMVPAHRWGYEQSVGPIPDGLTLDHLCRNEWCQNPAHMEPVTSGENSRRAIAHDSYQRNKPACPQGHPYEGENVHHYNGKRVCRTCKREKMRARRAAEKAA